VLLAGLADHHREHGRNLCLKRALTPYPPKWRMAATSVAVEGDHQPWYFPICTIPTCAYGSLPCFLWLAIPEVVAFGKRKPVLRNRLTLDRFGIRL